MCLECLLACRKVPCPSVQHCCAANKPAAPARSVLHSGARQCTAAPAVRVPARTCPRQRAVAIQQVERHVTAQVLEGRNLDGRGLRAQKRKRERMGTARQGGPSKQAIGAGPAAATPKFCRRRRHMTLCLVQPAVTACCCQPVSEHLPPSLLPSFPPRKRTSTSTPVALRRRSYSWSSLTDTNSSSTSLPAAGEEGGRARRRGRREGERVRWQ